MPYFRLDQSPHILKKYEEITKFLEKEIKKNKMTYPQLARKSNVARQQVQRWLYNKKYMNLISFLKILYGLDLELIVKTKEK